MAARKEIEKAVKFKEFQRSIEEFLTPEDKDYLFYALKEYNTYKSVAKLMLALNSCLDTPEKLDLLPYIRDLIPKHDKRRFDNLAPYSRMAHPTKLDPPTGTRGMGEGDHGTENLTRVVNLQRTRGIKLGFSIRGGQEHELGIYVSHVESLSQAEKAGIQIGDQLVRVNGIDFERVSHSSAVLVLKSHDYLKIEVKSTGKVPGQALTQNAFVWVDANGKTVEEVDEKPKKTRHSISRDERSPDRLLSLSDRHKIVLHSNQKRSLGFSIRGGSEYGLGIYISVVDAGSPSAEAGLQVGDQILDINGHSFLSILHFEAVHILKSYATLIMTIKSLGRIPTLQQNENKEVPLEQSPVTRRQSNEFIRMNSLPIRSSKRPSSATIKEEEEPEPENVPDAQNRPHSSSLKRSESDRQKSVSLPRSAGFDAVEHDHPKKSRSNSFGSESPNFSQRSHNLKKQMVVSPLAMHETRAFPSSPSPTSSPKVKPKFFEKGLGTQVMLANISSQAEQLLFDKARRILSKEDLEILKEDLVQYEDTGNVDQFVDCLISIFNTPEKMELLKDVRSVIKPTDIVRFDEIISPHELRTFREKMSESDSDSDFADDMDTKEEDVDVEDTDNGIVLTGVQHRKFSGDREKSLSLTFQDTFPIIKHTSSMSTPELSEVQSKETNLSWHADADNKTKPLSTSQNGHNSNRENHQNSRHSHQILQDHLILKPQGNPVIIDVNKEAPYIGLAIKTTPNNCVLVKEVRPGGAIDRHGFIQPGFEIVQVDNIRIRGKSYHNAAREIADAFKSDGPTVQFIVIPNYA